MHLLLNGDCLASKCSRGCDWELATINGGFQLHCKPLLGFRQPLDAGAGALLTDREYRPLVRSAVTPGTMPPLPTKQP